MQKAILYFLANTMFAKIRLLQNCLIFMSGDFGGRSQSRTIVLFYSYPHILIQVPPIKISRMPIIFHMDFQDKLYFSVFNAFGFY